MGVPNEMQGWECQKNVGMGVLSEIQGWECLMKYKDGNAKKMQDSEF